MAQSTRLTIDPSGERPRLSSEADSFPVTVTSVHNAQGIAEDSANHPRLVGWPARAARLSGSNDELRRHP
ncbi:MAG: hypothetical protein GEU71_06535 [Actinobacteria bacterium]|nr:hypothetical protein [Actinomycetota bacterium]